MNILIGEDDKFHITLPALSERIYQLFHLVINIKIAECTNEESSKANIFIQIILS